MKLLFAFAILFLVVLASADRFKYDYDFQVGFSKKQFRERIGQVNVAFKTTVDGLNWKYAFKAIVRPGQNNTVSTSTNYLPHQFKNVTFFWDTLENPRQSLTYLSHVKLIPTYLKNPLQIRLQTKTFCTRPLHGLVRSDGHKVNLYPCQM